jgi:hypothetical protein
MQAGESLMNIVTDFSIESIDKAVEENFYQYFDEWQDLYGDMIIKDNNMTRVMFPNIPHPLMNIIFRCHLTDNIESTIQNTISLYAKNSLPFLWQIEPSSHPTNLGQRLAEHGLQSLGNSPVLAIDTGAITEKSNSPDNFEIRRVSTKGLLDDFQTVWGLGFQVPDFVVDPLTNMLLSLGFDKQNKIQNYVGFLNDEPVSVGTTFYGGGVAGLYNGTVLESARGKGIGTANTLHRIYEAKSQGYIYAFMVSAGNAYNLYKRLGFKDFTAWERFLWTPTESDHPEAS